MTVTSTSPSGFAPRSVQTTSTGYYTLSDLPAGRSYTIRPTLTGYSFRPATKSFPDLSTNQAVGPATSFSGSQ
jgi:hypothetical protein